MSVSHSARVAWALMLVAAAVSGACSLLIDDNSNQCASNEDCERFGTFPLCQEGICVPSGLGPPGCTKRNPPNTAEEIQSQCTTAQCIPFDNCGRLGVCDGGALPDLIPRP
jgi:hypothetical protein